MNNSSFNTGAQISQEIGSGTATVLASVAQDYSASSPYSIGDYAIHESVLYRCTSAIASPGEAWNPEHWEGVTVGVELTGLSEDVAAAMEAAQGKTATYVVDAKTDITYSSESANGDLNGVTAITGVVVADLKLGDVILIKAVDVPDYWVSAVSSGSVTLSKMETTKVDLAGYVTGTGLTADKILLGDGGSAAKTSSKGISTAKPASADDGNVPTVGAVYAGLQDKQDNLVSGTNIKTVDGRSVLGSGDLESVEKITISGATGTLDGATLAKILAYPQRFVLFFGGDAYRFGADNGSILLYCVYTCYDSSSMSIEMIRFVIDKSTGAYYREAIVSHDNTKEDVSNKTTSLSDSSTDTQYPSAKATYDADLVAKYHLGAFDSVNGNVITRQTGYIRFNGNEACVKYAGQSGGTDMYAISLNVELPDTTTNIVCSRDYVPGVASNLNAETGIVEIQNNTAFFKPTSDITNVTQMLASVVDLYLQYRLAVAYTESVPENLPLNTFDQTGSEWLREEWEKALNLCNESDIAIGDVNNPSEKRARLTIGYFPEGFTFSYKFYGNYRASIVITSEPMPGTLSEIIYNGIDNTPYLTSGTYTMSQAGYLGFVFSNTDVLTYIDLSTLKSNLKLMVVKGDHVYPYKPYSGPIVHESDLDAAKAEIDADLATKQDTLVSGTNIKTIDGSSVLGSGNIVTPKMVSCTWADLKSDRDNGRLIPGMQYRITDYTCTTVAANTSSAGNVFDIIVVADATNKLNEVARACLHAGDTYFANSKLEAWRLWYCLDNDTSRFDWADSTNGKGVIYRMIDDSGNDVPYDFKNIIYIFRSKITIGRFAYSADYIYERNPSLDADGYYGWSATTPVSYGAKTQYFTDTDTPTLSSTVYSNTSGTAISEKIKAIQNENFSTYTFNIVVDSVNADASLNGYAKQCYHNIIKGYSSLTKTILNRTIFRLYDIDYGNIHCGCYDNVFDINNHNNVFLGSEVYGNRIGENFYDNRMSAPGNQLSFYGNDLKNDFHSNNIVHSFHDNTIGSKFNSNTIGSYFYYNTIGSNFNYNTIGSNSYSNTIGSNFSYNTIGSYFAYNTTGSYFYYNSIGSSASESVYVRYCKFDDGVQYVSFTSDDTSASSSNYLQNVHIHLGVKGSSTSNRKTISVPDRNLTYSIDYYASGSQDIILD